jgi:hypothetical protein
MNKQVPTVTLHVCLLIAAVAAGCGGVQVRPEPFDCPKPTQKVMAEQLGWSSGDLFVLALDDRWDWRAEPVLRPGEVVGRVPENIPWAQRKKTPPGTQFWGQLYVDSESGNGDEPAEVIVKYERVKVPGQEERPVCLVARSFRVYALEKDGSAKASNSGGASVRNTYP